MEATIAAVCTPPGSGAIGVIRISGGEAFAVAQRIFHTGNGVSVAEMGSHTVAVGKITDPVSGRIVDEAVLTKFVAPRSFTGEDVVELSCHGGGTLLRLVLDLCLQNGARLAQPGEFSKRAFLNGKMDLSRAEAVIELITAKSELAVYNNALLLSGSVADEVTRVREELLQLAASVLAKVEYPEEEIDEVDVRETTRAIAAFRAVLDRLLDGCRTGAALTEGVKTALVGRPNVGKSSLLNFLLRENRAIVTDIAGTTRDTVEGYCSLRGVLFRLIDTAGLRDTQDPIEQIGVARARQALEEAQIVIFIRDGSQPPCEEDAEIEALLGEKSVISVLSKADLGLRHPGPGLALSAKTGQGAEELIEELVDRAGIAADQIGATPFITSARQKEALRSAIEALCRAEEAAAAGVELDLITIDLQQAIASLGEIDGKSVSDEVVENIFSRFCIGK